jgi:hypothetical protein
MSLWQTNKLIHSLVWFTCLHLTLIAIVRQESPAIEQYVQEWVSDYGENALKAFAQLVTFIIHASGCTPAKISAKEVKNTDEVIETATNSFPNGVCYQNNF